MRVEVQFRTIAMDFWASLDHKLKYKKNVKNPEIIVNELRKCADIISRVDLRNSEYDRRRRAVRSFLKE